MSDGMSDGTRRGIFDGISDKLKLGIRMECRKGSRVERNLGYPLECRM